MALTRVKAIFRLCHNVSRIKTYLYNMSTPHLSLRTVEVTRYVTPLREGGSLPAIVEADDGFMYVLKFRGAGQGVKALIAELIGSEVARMLGFRVPELVLAQVDPAFGRTEPDEEIQDLLKFSEGLNLALHYLSGAISYDPAVNRVDEMIASKIVWMDALLMNVDRTARNTNMLIWQKELWLIDHGAALYFHHSGTSPQKAAENPFPMIKDHVLLKAAANMQGADGTCRDLLSREKIDAILAAVPGEWLTAAGAANAEEGREMYRQFFEQRIRHSHIFVNEAEHARKTLI